MSRSLAIIYNTTCNRTQYQHSLVLLSGVEENTREYILRKFIDNIVKGNVSQSTHNINSRSRCYAIQLVTVLIYSNQKINHVKDLNLFQQDILSYARFAAAIKT